MAEYKKIDLKFTVDWTKLPDLPAEANDWSRLRLSRWFDHGMAALFAAQMLQDYFDGEYYDAELLGHVLLQYPRSMRLKLCHVLEAILSQDTGTGYKRHLTSILSACHPSSTDGARVLPKAPGSE